MIREPIMGMKKILLLLAMAVLAGCGGNKEERSEAGVSDTIKQPIVQSFKIGTFDKENILKKFEVKGTIINGSRWTDRNGDNYVVLAQVSKERTAEDVYMKSITLTAYHYADFNSGTYREVRKVQDFTRDCEYNNIAAFLPATLSVTDIDKNNLGEVTFMYKLGCKSELSPDDLKLIMMENGVKYAVRGESIVYMGDMKLGGKKEIDKSFNNAPQAFLNFANELWDRNKEDKSSL